MYCTRFDRKTYTEELIYLGHYINMNTQVNRGLTIDEYQYKSCLIQIIRNKKLPALNKKIKINELFIMNIGENDKGIATKALDLFREKYSKQYKNLYGYDIVENGFFTHYAKSRKLKERKEVFDREYILFNLNEVKEIKNGKQNRSIIQ